MKKAFTQLHIAVFLAGFTAILGKLIGLNEGLLVWYRLLLTVLALVVILFIRKQLVRLSMQDMLQVFGVGGIIAFHWVTFYGSVKYANVSVAVVCLAASGFFTAFLEPIIFKRRIKPVEIILGLLAIIGIYIIFDFHPQYKLGIIFGIFAALGSSLFPIFNKKLINRFTPSILTLYEMIGGLIVLSILIPVYLYFFPATYFLPTLADWWWLIVLALLCTVLCFDLQLNALKKISPFTSNLAYNLEPVYGIILGFIFFKENKALHTQFYLGVALIIIAVALQTALVISSHRKKKA
ncbi:DMT family transporter [Ferruginibacter sp. SUN002]|uniref:DMT family transporter n=1 Tax=Ferruginibacter sp. SUN002 TaxID=2937789 RepID=UPI003D36A89A